MLMTIYVYIHVFYDWYQDVRSEEPTRTSKNKKKSSSILG